jgi:hypothetical protein
MVLRASVERDGSGSAAAPLDGGVRCRRQRYGDVQSRPEVDAAVKPGPAARSVLWLRGESIPKGWTMTSL